MELRPTIDREWLERVSAQDPIGHAYARWDLDHVPNRVRFVSAMDGDETVGYLLIWLGHPDRTVVHWAGTDPRTRVLANSLPPRPFVAVVPEAFQDLVVSARGPARPYTLLLLRIDPTAPPRDRPNPPSSAEVRRLERSDHSALAAFAERQTDLVAADYPYVDPGEEFIWGAFSQGRIVGAVRAAVRLPEIWLLNGVFVDPPARGRGIGRALVGAALDSARAARTPVGLYAREDRLEARRLYERLGFRAVGRRTWLDLGTGSAP